MANDSIQDPVLTTLISIAGEIVALQALGELALKSDILTSELEDHMRTLNGLQNDICTAMAARILMLANAEKSNYGR